MPEPLTCPRCRYRQHVHPWLSVFTCDRCGFRGRIFRARTRDDCLHEQANERKAAES